jgi:putative transcriptional regulator
MTIPEGHTSLKGRLLVASPNLVDKNFFRTVIFLIEHTDEGAAGVVLNRPSDSSLSDGPLDAWDSLAADPPLVFVGGPVEQSAAVCLARPAPNAQPDGFQPVLQGLGVLDLGCDPRDIRPGLDRLRVFVGYAGWEAGQLEGEIEEGAWYVLDADPEDALCPQPGGLWRFVLKRQGGQLALVANFPADPTMN